MHRLVSPFVVHQPKRQVLTSRTIHRSTDCATYVCMLFRGGLAEEIKQTIETVGDVVRNERVKLGYVLFVFLLYVPVNSYGHGRTASSPNTLFPGQV